MAILSKKVMNVIYSVGAAIVILGALFKIMHWPFGNEMLIIGLVTEALVFTLSAFDTVEKDIDWTLVYPELATGEARKKEVKKQEENADAQGALSKKLDNLLKEAKIDGELMASLGSSIKNFESAAKGISPAADGIAATNKYSEQLALAASQMESLNSLYKVQLESTSRNAEANKEIADNAAMLKEQMQSMTANIASLNNVYGGMLSAMGGNTN